MLSNTGIFKFSMPENIQATLLKMLAWYKLAFRPPACRREEETVLKYLQNSIKKGDTVLDIGSWESTLYFMRKRVKQQGKVIAFELQDYSYQHLCQLKKVLEWKNVDLEYMPLLHATTAMPAGMSQDEKQDPVFTIATVINMQEHLNGQRSQDTLQTLDEYCLNNTVRPDFLKINAAGEELKILRGAGKSLKLYKPRILVRCEERISGAANVTETFNLLLQLGYTGFFILDTLRIPLGNFDFNVYQNGCKNFYCSYFIFE